MSLLDALARRRTTALSGVPFGFTAIAEALVAGTDVEGACRVAGHRLAEVGLSLEEVLDGLALSYRTALGAADPDVRAVRAVALGWADTSLQYFHGLSCEDPLTGLATTAHARSRIAALYRTAACDGSSVADTHALVVVELVADGDSRDAGRGSIDLALRLVDVQVTIRVVYSCGETIARAGVRRVPTLARRTPRIGGQVALLRQMLADWAEAPMRHRVWIEGLPSTDEQAGRLLDELAR